MTKYSGQFKQGAKRRAAALLVGSLLLLTACGTGTGGTGGTSGTGGTGDTGDTPVVPDIPSVPDTPVVPDAPSAPEGEVLPEPASLSACLTATDSLGRAFDAFTQTDGRQVGLFYFLWAGQHGSADHDISKLDLVTIKNDTSTVGKFHYWGEPLYGYYDSGDEWVFRKHLELLTAAGVDYFTFDVTNGYLYEEVLSHILPIMLEYYEQGWSVPKVMFYTYANSKDTVTALYDAFYSPSSKNGEKYAPLWYRYPDTGNANAEGRPWLAARTGTGDGQDFENCSQEIRQFFYLKDGQWPNAPMRQNGMPWMSWAGEAENFAQYDHNGIMSVSVAQHTAGAFSDSVLLGDRTRNRGRGWTRVSRQNDASLVRSGANFQDQWDYALSVPSVNNVFVTGWNEWVAQKQAPGNGRADCYFVDLYNEEFSRDIEMTKGGYGDNFYLQLAQNIRSFKHATAGEELFDARRRTISLNEEAVWGAAPGYCDFKGDVAPRNYKSASSREKPYTDASGRNDITLVRVAHDGEYLYFGVECAEAITPYEAGDKTWMNILIETENGGSGWEGYQYVLDRSVAAPYTMVERLQADGSSSIVATADLFVQGNRLIVRVEKSALGLSGDDFTLRFKVCDHVTHYLDIMDYYVSGDCAPIGRLNYFYGSRRETA